MIQQIRESNADNKQRQGSGIEAPADELNNQILQKIKNERKHYFLYGGGHREVASTVPVSKVALSSQDNQTQPAARHMITLPVVEQQPRSWATHQSHYNICSPSNAESSFQRYQFNRTLNAKNNNTPKMLTKLTVKDKQMNVINDANLQFKDNFYKIKLGSKVGIKDKRYSLMIQSNDNNNSTTDHFVFSPKQSMLPISPAKRTMNKTSLAALSPQNQNESSINFRRTDVSNLQKQTGSEFGSLTNLTSEQGGKRSVTQEQIQRAIQMVKQKLNIQSKKSTALQTNVQSNTTSPKVSLPRDISIAQFDDKGEFKGFPTGSISNPNALQPYPIIKPTIQKNLENIHETKSMNESKSLSSDQFLPDFVASYTRDSQLDTAKQQFQQSNQNEVQGGLDDQGTWSQVFQITKNKIQKKMKQDQVEKLLTKQINGKSRQSPDSLIVYQHMSNRQKRASPKNESATLYRGPSPANIFWEQEQQKQEAVEYKPKTFAEIKQEYLPDHGRPKQRQQRKEAREVDEIYTEYIPDKSVTVFPAIREPKRPPSIQSPASIIKSPTQKSSQKKSLRSQSTVPKKQVVTKKESENLEVKLQKIQSQLKYSIKARKEKAMRIREEFIQTQQEFYKENPQLSPQRLSIETLKNIEKKKLSVAKEKQTIFKDITEDQEVISLILINATGKETESTILQSHWNLVRNAGDQTELVEYLKFLTGVSKNKKHIGAKLVAKLGSKLYDKVKDYKSLFEEYVTKEANIMQEIADRLESRIKMINVVKEGHTTSIEERYRDDPHFIYFQKCQKNEEPVLPLLEYVFNKTLCLQSYTLSIGQCKALAQAFENFQNAGINRVIFDNCGIDDDEFSNLLEGIQKLDDFKKIIYRRNQFKEKSLEQLIKIIRRKVPNHLEELRIENCKIPPEVTRQLITELGTKSYIQNLALVSIKFSDEAWNLFLGYLETSGSLQEIDISWACIGPPQIQDLFNVIRGNTQLQYINLSQIQLFRSETVPEKSLDQLPEDIQSSIDNLIGFIKRNSKLIHVNLTNCGLNLKMLYQFGAALRRSKSIRALHLSDNSALSDPYEARSVIDYLVKRAHCIKARHYNVIDFKQLPSNLLFSQGLMQGRISRMENEQSEAAASRLSGYNDSPEGKPQSLGDSLRGKMQEKILGSLRTQKAQLNFKDRLASQLQGEVIKQKIHQQNLGMSYQNSVVIDQGSPPTLFSQKTIADQLNENGVKFNKENFIQSSGKLAGEEAAIDDSQAKYMKDRLDEAAKLKFLQKQKNMELTVTQDVNHDKRPLIITRVLGHKEDMPGKGQWKIITKCPTGQNECWVCDKQIYSIIFWNQLIGKIELRKFTQEDQQFLAAKLKSFNPNESSDLAKLKCTNNAPFIYGQFTNWKPQQMQDIREFCEKIDKDKPDIFEKMKKEYKIPLKFNRVEELRGGLKENYEAEVRVYAEGYRKIWKDIVQKFLKYEKPNLVNASNKEYVDKLDIPLYIFPTFMSSGKQYYVVRQKKENGQVSWFPGNCIVKHRSERIFKFRKQFRKIPIIPKFSKGSSVFSAWKQDDSVTLKRAIEHDLRYWKGTRFIKDTNDYNNTVAAIKNHFPVLKNQFIYLASGSTFPTIGLNEWTNYAKRAGFTDSKLVPSTLDRLFIAANVEIEDQALNPDKALIRFEFVELLVRVAKERYWKDGACKTVCEALEMLMEKEVLPNSNADEWQDFRDKVLYTVEVNRLFLTNQTEIQTVRNLYLSPSQRQLTLENVLHLFTTLSDVQLSEKETIYCYGMCKMTLAQENEDQDRRYWRLANVEFLEMIGRVAYLKFQGSELENYPMHIKIEHVLDDLFAAVPGLRRRIVSYEPEEETESDQDY